jgi:hypothetical protein
MPEVQDRVYQLYPEDNEQTRAKRTVFIPMHGLEQAIKQHSF